jgi:hypothetical protein
MSAIPSLHCAAGQPCNRHDAGAGIRDEGQVGVFEPGDERQNELLDKI